MTEVIRIGGYAPADSSHSLALTRFRDRLTDHLGDQVSVEVLWNILDEGRPAPDLLDMVEAGELTFCYFSTSYLGHRVPELDVLEVPFLFDSLQTAHRSLDGDLGQALTAATERQTGLTALGYWDNGFRHFTNRLRPVTRPADCVGMAVRLQPNRYHEAMIESWGAIPVPIELKAGIAKIASGEVDAQENPLANMVAYGVDQVHPYATMTGHLYGARGLYANPDQVAAWPAHIAAAIREALDDAISFQRAVAADKEAQLRTRLEGDGLHFTDLSSRERDAFRQASAEVIAAAHRDLDSELFRHLEQ